MNKAVVDYFFVELNLGAHFEALRRFLLMEDGEFAQSLSDLLFEKVSPGGPGARAAAGRLWTGRLWMLWDSVSCPCSSGRARRPGSFSAPWCSTQC